MASKSPQRVRSFAARNRRRAAVRQLKRLLLRAGAYGWLRRRRPTPYPALLRYHAVAGDEARLYAGSGITVTPAAFERHVGYLSRHYNVADLDAVDAYLNGDAAAGANTVAFTFDDGYHDNLEASRVLRRHGCNGTFYLTTGRLRGGAQALWCVDIRMRVISAAGKRVEVDWEGERLELPLDTPQAREASISIFNSWIKKRTVVERERLLAHLDSVLPIADEVARRPARVMLDWDEVREMRDSGMLLGGHTTTHANLVHASESEALDEIGGCHEALARELGAPPRHLAYPNGGADRHFDERAKRIVRETGFVTAVTSLPGLVRQGSDRFELRRVGSGPSLAELVHELEWWKRGGDV
jgi:peptidoglycan/xylan/chitin deacetylase (PgdA/CDA1 family)